MTAQLALAVGFLAYANGANDNFKGVASLYGSKTTRYRAALAWGTLTTFAGSLAAIVLAKSLMVKFSGLGMVPDALASSDGQALAIAVGAGITVMLAAVAGFPISTTHALTGAMVGAAWAAARAQVELGPIGRAFVLPLLLSPLLAVVLSVGIRPLLRAPQRRGSARDARRVHLLSAGSVGFARGLNDAPKMAALLVAVPALDSSRAALFAVAVAMAVGGLLGARRVAETMSFGITAIDHGQGLTANLATSALVTTASLFGVPVSTTHVSVGALFGVGLTGRQADARVVSNILLSWIVTLPLAAAVGAVTLSLMRP